MDRSFVITGPTSVGKTKYVNQLLDKYPFEVINMDASQIFSFFKFGTGRNDATVSSSHHLYGIRDPHEGFLAPQDYAGLVLPIITDIRSRKKIPLFEGDAVDYLRAISKLCPLTIVGLKAPNLDWLQRKMEDRYERVNIQDLIEECQNGLKLGYRETGIMSNFFAYMPIIEYIENKISLQELKPKLIKDAQIAYAQQMNEFDKSDLDINWIVASDNTLSQIENIIDGYLAESKLSE